MFDLSGKLDKSKKSVAALITTGEAARLCGVDPKTIGRWADAGVLKSHRTVGGRRRMLRSDILAFIHARGIPQITPEAPAGPRIAVVDDEPRAARALLRSLVQLAPAAECRTAHDGLRTGALLTSFRPQLVFVNATMPGLSGTDVCKHVRSTSELAHTAVVVVTAQPSQALRARLKAAGAAEVIRKPIVRAELEAVVANFVGPRAANGR